jgi:hypothetical protein
MLNLIDYIKELSQIAVQEPEVEVEDVDVHELVTDSGKITVATRTVSDRVEISVTDSGVGISEEDLPTSSTSSIRYPARRGCRRSPSRYKDLRPAAGPRVPDHHVRRPSATSPG